MTTLEEQVDELIGMARDLGDYQADLREYQRVADLWGPRTIEGRRARRSLPRIRKSVQWATARLAKCRADFLARHGEAP